MFGSTCAQAADLHAVLSNQTVLASGWHFTQDERDLGEKLGWYKPDFPADWEPLPKLDYLQLILANQPYFGRGLRYFNDHPWWYRVEFKTPKPTPQSLLRFGGVDYFSKVWLNGKLLGTHEGYVDPFEFDVSKSLRYDRPNVLVVEVSSPWDHEYVNPLIDPAWGVKRNLIKGTYEHADTFVQRDVNPVGIWRPVTLVQTGEVRAVQAPTVESTLVENFTRANVRIDWPIENVGLPYYAKLDVAIRDLRTGKVAARKHNLVQLGQGATTLDTSTTVYRPSLWTTWDRGSQPLYRAEVSLNFGSSAKLVASTEFGIRSVELRRSAQETRFFLNGHPLYLRGTTYWPDEYISKSDVDRYTRDIKRAVADGFNAFRMHVHTENPDFYRLCDEFGMAVIQDNDLNWNFPTDDEFIDRAASHFGTLIDLLKQHPSVIAWIAMNEVGMQDGLVKLQPPQVKLGERLWRVAEERDPNRPVIEDSVDASSIRSGDTHDYSGSLFGGSYFDIFPKKDKLVTEFGADALPNYGSLRKIPQVADRLKDVSAKTDEIQDYQYQLIKYYVEHYRIQKYTPNAGYFQFMFIDFSPQSFYGVYDYWGAAKDSGLGGGLRALHESNQPIGIFLEHKDAPVALHAVNDTSKDLRNCLAKWQVFESGKLILSGSQRVNVAADSHVRIRDLSFPVDRSKSYDIKLDLVAANGALLTHNEYVNPFKALPLPQGYPDRMDDELGVRLWWARNQ